MDVDLHISGRYFRLAVPHEREIGEDERSFLRNIDSIVSVYISS